ncbi:MAG: hypothetical protein V3R56_05720 [Xanthomonadales bacterium]
MGEFPRGESTAGTQDGAETDGSEGEPGVEDSSDSEQDASGSEVEPGFGSGDYAAGDDDVLPDLRDEPSLEEALESFEEAMGEAAGDLAQGDPATAGSGGDSAAQGGAAGTPAASGTDAPGSLGNNDSSSGTGGAGPLTPAERAAILDRQLERGTGEFDAMILAEQAAQRRAAREQAPSSAAIPASTNTGSASGYEGGIADAGVYSTGGGLGGDSRPGGGAGLPRNTAKYPPPAGIPSGSDDDVVARQLREAAMREPDPAIREKLWHEYRKYKGID